MKSIKVDYTKRCVDEPTKGHNRWHPKIPPAIEVDPGEEVELETRDAFDGQITPATSTEAIGRLNLNVVHPLTGPVFVKGAEPGDLIDIEIRDVKAASIGYTVEVPGFGFLRDDFPKPFYVKWQISKGYAVSEQLPNVRIKGAPFAGTIGLAPSVELMARIQKREKALADKGGFVLLPDTTDAVPQTAAIAAEALRTIPPRETAGNVDIKQLSKGTHLFLPVYEPGALFSVGDAHFAQGDSECCGTAIEMTATFLVRFGLRKGEAARRRINDAQFSREEHQASELAAPRRFYATTGLSVTKDGENHSEDATLAARNALLNMIDYLVNERGFNAQQAYAICSVAVDLKISELVDVPNFVVSAFLPLDIFTN